MFYRILLFSFLTLFTFQLNAQLVGIGDWQIHIPYNLGIEMINVGNKVYCMGENGLYTYDTDANEMQKISKIDGLSDFKFSAMGYHEPSGSIIIGYENGNIDILQGNTITSVASIKNAQNIFGSKVINKIVPYEEFVFLCTDFGVSKLDVKKAQIKETYQEFLSPDQNVRVFNLRPDPKTDTLLIATNIGIFGAKLSSTNLIDFSSWEHFSLWIKGFPNRLVTAFGSIGDTIYSVNRKDIYKRTTGSWFQINNPFDIDDDINEIVAIDDDLYFCNNSGVYLMKNDTIFSKISSPSFSYTTKIIKDNDDKLWVSDGQLGFFRQKDDLEFEFFQPNGPRTTDAFRIDFINNLIYVSTGSFSSGSKSPQFNKEGFFSYDNARWASNNLKTEARDIIDIAYHENRKELYLASYSDGLVMINEEDEIKIFNDTTPITTTDPPFQSPLGFIWPQTRIGAVETDKNGDVWFSTFIPDGAPQLYRINTDGTWNSFFLSRSSQADEIEEFRFDENNNLWAHTGRAGTVIIVSPEGELLNVLSTELPGDPNALEIDKNGDIWIGTGEGIVVAKNSSDDLTNITLEKPILEGRFLLEEEIVTTIAIDAANRKWVGTENGLWLLNADGTEQINYFSSDNSPLLSNKIGDIELNQSTGELFIGTNLGIISYRTESAKSTNNCENEIKVFPNPVTPQFAGKVGILGAPDNAIIKITDISGKLIHETDAYGAQGIWDVTGLDGQRAKTGVYLAYISSSDGEFSCVTKIAVVE